jgi:hypothetical protein
VRPAPVACACRTAAHPPRQSAAPSRPPAACCRRVGVCMRELQAGWQVVSCQQRQPRHRRGDHTSTSSSTHLPRPCTCGSSRSILDMPELSVGVVTGRRPVRGVNGHRGAPVPPEPHRTGNAHRRRERRTHP